MLYLHIPFCEKRCGYCAFNTFAKKTALIDRYIDALTRQLDSELALRKTHFSSVYFGGGTPSILNIRQFEKIFKKISSYINKETEITIEANPSSWNEEKAKALLSMGANRLSLGVQSLNDEKLLFLSRAHDKKAALEAYDASIRAGFENISIDFMYDTPFDDEAFVARELDRFLALDAAHISAYSLTIEEGTPFEKNGVKTRYDADIAKSIAARIKEAGYEHYEVASFGKKRSKHNFGYWEYRLYIGVGAGAAGFDGASRLYPHTDIDEYIENPLFKEIEPISREHERVERILLGLRSVVGVDKKLLPQTELQTLIENNFLTEIDDRVYANDLFLADELASRLI